MANDAEYDDEAEEAEEAEEADDAYENECSTKLLEGR
jgi:hypothetical protein